MKHVQNDQELIQKQSEFITYLINEIVKTGYSKVVKLTFQIIEGNLFLFEEVDNKLVENKRNIAIHLNDLSILYIFLYEKFKTLYLEDKEIAIDVFEMADLKQSDNPFLILNLRNPIHKNIVYFKLKNYGNEREALNQIKEDWINLTTELSNEKKSKKM